jgi:hypothetical protein
MSIASSSILVELNISVWTANKLDKRITNDVLVSNGALTADAGQFRKNLMSGTTLRKEIADFAASCRLWHNTTTLPWADRGARLLPTSLFLDYKTEANRRMVQFNHMVEHFIREYPQLQAQAQQHMGALYNAEDYPSVHEVVSKFGFKMVFTPLPEAGDFRLDVANEDLEELRKQYDTNINSRLTEAMQSQWDKLHDMLVRMSEKLVDPEDEDTGPKRRWHDTFISNAHEMCQMLGHLNVTKDPKLEEARRKLEQAVAGVHIDDIKDSDITRADVKTKLDAILSDYNW